MKPFYFGTIKNIVAGFGTMFSDIHIEKIHDDNEVVDIRVPLHYGPRHAWYEKLKEKLRDEEGAAKISRTLPRISFEMGNMAFANDRNTPKMNSRIHREKDNALKSRIYHQHYPIPWDYDFTVSIAAKNIQDGLRIIEQIVPMFRPDHTITIEELPALDIKEDITVNMLGITHGDTFEGPVSSTTRVITWEITFRVHGHIFPPIRDAKLITEVNASIQEYNSKQGAKVTAKRTKENNKWKDTVTTTDLIG